MEDVESSSERNQNENLLNKDCTGMYSWRIVHMKRETHNFSSYSGQPKPASSIS